jgi:FkbM family methyltransferase
VIALEPSERELVHLQRNLRINRFADVDVIPLAIGEHVGRATLNLAEPGHAGHNALGAPAAPGVSVVDRIAVDVTTLDTLADTRNWPRIDLIKMDVEGSELNALRGADRLLARDRPMLLLEAEQESLSLRNSSFCELLAWLAARKYCAMDFSNVDGFPTLLGTREPSTVNLVFMPEEQLAPAAARASAG